MDPRLEQMWRSFAQHFSFHFSSVQQNESQLCRLVRPGRGGGGGGPRHGLHR